MNSEGQIRSAKVKAPNNIYTIMLGLAFLVVMATVFFVAYKNYSQYGTWFTIPTIR